MIDLLYTAHNRLEFVQETFSALLKNTNWNRVAHLHVLDDQSSDGTDRYLISEISENASQLPCPVDCVSDEFGGPVAAMNYALDRCETDVLVKVDSDLLVCPGWIDVLLDVLDAHEWCDVLGFEAGFGGKLHEPGDVFDLRSARHVGGLGCFRTRMFEKRRPKAHETYFGLTEFMRRHADCAWLTPDLPCFLMDHLPFEPWRSLAASYVERGWSRAWSSYSDTMSDYWTWHFAEQAVA